MTSDSSSGGKANGAEGDERALREEVVGLVAPDGLADPDFAKLRASLQQQLAQERGLHAQLRSRSTRARITIAASAVLAVSAVAAVGALRADHGVYPVERMVAILSFLGVVVAFEIVAALWPIQLPAWPPWLPPTALAAGLGGLFVLYALPAAHHAHPASLQAPGMAALLARALPCLAIGGAVALALYGLLRSLDRGGADRAVSGAACAGLAANIALQLHCPITAPAHMLIGHFAVALLLVAAVAARRVVRPR